ncbi:hypothetical protein [Salipiger thiooxidans]|uniref:hypothetical protein n=1 Tax=Salipiger thiooxidans TaxID=282683 RepID=UPI001CD4B24E|nr:hypothetical protein [Salipiger thiooxidans]MCA0849999.1 hypothetical protein [Salipiger thiooxidans]
MLTAKTIVAITGSAKYEDRMASFAERLNTYAASDLHPILREILHVAFMEKLLTDPLKKSGS